MKFIIFMSTLKKIKLKTYLPFVLILSLFFPFTASAATYTIKAGDTLYDIGWRYNISVQALQEANGITGHLIFPGQQLLIPEIKQEDRKTTQSTPSSTNALATEQNKETPTPVQPVAPEEQKTPDSPAQVQVFYPVQAGDCLYAIANYFGISVEALMQANNITSPLIYPGQTLGIPAPAGANNPRPAASTGNNLPSRSISLNPAGKILNYAASFLGSRYVYGGSGPNTFDCSGFVSYVFRISGFNLPHDAAEQANFGAPVDRSSLQPGDLVFFSYYGSREINHVGIYTGGNEFIHASTKSGVKYSSLSESYYQQNYRGARRLLDR